MMSMWWLLVAFILGGYAGAIVVGLMSMAAGRDEDVAAEKALVKRLRDRPRRERHGTRVQAHV